MTDQELLAIATKFDAGNPVQIMGYLVEETCETYDYRLYVECCNIETRASWGIFYNSLVFDKIENDFVYNGMPSNRPKDFLERTRFKSAKEALEFIYKWKEEKRSKLREEGYKTISEGCDYEQKSKKKKL